MTKAELIFKIAKRAGIPESEAKVFFESFLKKIASNINAGGAVHLENLGVFIIKEGVSDALNARRNEARIEHKISELVVFQPEDSLNSGETNTAGSGEALIFNIPNAKGEAKANIDSYFSLSFDKPVVNRDNPAEVEEYYPVSRNEQKRMLESKAEKLFSEVKIYDRFGKESEKYLFIGAQRPDSSDGILADSALKINESASNDGQKSWALDKNIEKQIEAESLLDIEVEDEELDISKLVKENLSWDFGANQENKELEPEQAEANVHDVEIPTAGEDENKSASENEPARQPENTYSAESGFEPEEEVNWDFGLEPEEITREYGKIEEELELDVPSGSSSISKKTGEDLVTEYLSEIPESRKLEYEKPQKPAEDFQSVNSITSELQKLTVVEDQLNWDFGRSEPEDELPIPAEESFKEIAREDGFFEVSRASQIESSIAAAPELPKSTFKPVADFEKKPSRFFSIVKYFVFSLIGALVVLIVVYSYFKFVKHQDLLNKYNAQAIIPGVEKKKTEVIERNYEVPVTYPYEKKAPENVEAASASIPMPEASAPQNIKETNAQKQNAPKETQKTPGYKEEITPEQMFSANSPMNKKNVKQLQKAEQQQQKKGTNEKAVNEKASAMPKAGEHSSFDGSQHVIQVSSWPAKEKADMEAAKLKKLGYSAFVTSAYIDAKKATWYRVKIGGFKTKEEAERVYGKIFK
jgi:nucleoid DNA-binding protein/cell division septation protein DedD